MREYESEREEGGKSVREKEREENKKERGGEGKRQSTRLSEKSLPTDVREKKMVKMP